MNRRTRTCNPPSSEIKSPDGKLRRYCRDVKRGKTTCSKYVRVPKISYKNLPRAILCQVGVEIWLKFTVPPPSSLGEPRRYCFLWIIDFFFQLLKKTPRPGPGGRCRWWPPPQTISCHFGTHHAGLPPNRNASVCGVLFGRVSCCCCYCCCSVWRVFIFMHIYASSATTFLGVVF